jgi:acyl transferase domain-containing protein/NADPH:quinone reductase-like Zn-dependent oxidoreductase/NADP-dependent 3-hydroxy acid dehydrogenase YdfG/ubiquinone/menaquinone biosynthesis C-methylase UbiE/acyl carrier protein
VVGEVPAERFEAAAFTAPSGGRRPGLAYTAAGGFLADDPALFDAPYFGMSPKEASRLDPQQRLLLECAVEALDDAGLDASTLRGSDTAVLVGASTADYFQLQQRRPDTANAYTMTGGALSNTANRVSHLLDLRGPSLTVDTACSSALTAVHEACGKLRSGASALALAGGVSLLLSPFPYVGFSQASMLSPTGRCRPFSARADGYVRAEGAGVLVLKPLRAALADGDRVHAVILASEANADGRTTGLSQPSPRAQAELLRRVYTEAGIKPDDVSYVEAHGTGTPAGDPIECEALGRVLGRHEHGGLPIGSVKSNLGHLEAASGIAGLLKAILVLREQRIPATLHAEPLSEAIDFPGLGLAPVTTQRPLTGSGRRLIGVNSFGFGGANTHVVLATAPTPGVRVVADEGARLPVIVSARTPGALEETARAWADYLDGADQAAFYDAAFTACRRRTRYEHRMAVLATSPAQAARSLRALADGDTPPGAASGTAVERGRVAFVFCGSGSPWVGMGRDLLAIDPAFRAEVAAVDEELAPYLGWSVLEELAAPSDPGRWARPEVHQPLLFTVQAGLVRALAVRGIVPAAVAGHSVGEVAAAYCAGALDRAAACRVLAERSNAQARTAGFGRMAAVGLRVTEAEKTLARWPGRLVIAGVNSDHDVTVAGDVTALAELGAELAAREVFFRDLGLDYASHSPAMDPLEAGVKDRLADLEPVRGRVPMVSTVTGTRVDGTALDAGYWWHNLRKPVEFRKAVAELTGTEGCDVLLEVGPHPVLATYLRRSAAACRRPVAVVPTMRRDDAGASVLDTALARLFVAGVETDWKVPFPRPGRVVTAPRYPWQRERHWNGNPAWWRESAHDDDAPVAEHPLLGPRQQTAQPAWRQQIRYGRPVWLADHRVGDTVVLPAAAYVELALAAGQQLLDGPCELSRLSIGRTLTVSADESAPDLYLHTTLTRDGEFTVTSRQGTGGDWRDHARCRVRKLLRTRPPALDTQAITARLTTVIDAEEHYAACDRAGLRYGPAFRTLTGLLLGSGEVLATYEAAAEPEDGHIVHPTLLDGALQAALPLIAALAEPQDAAFLPTGFEAVRCWQQLPATGTVHVRSRIAFEHQTCWDLTVTDTQGTVAMELSGVRVQRFDAALTRRAPRLTEVLRPAPLPSDPTPLPPLPAPADLLAACAPEVTAPVGSSAHTYLAQRARVQELSAHFTAAAVRELLPGRERFGIDDLLLAGVLPRYIRLLRTLIAAATDCGLFARTDGSWRPTATPDPHRVFQQALRELPAESATLQAHGVCGRHLTAVLRGEQDPLELLFSVPDSLAARYYDGNRGIHHANQVARRLVRALVDHWPADRMLRVLEVGAGTGSATALILPELPMTRVRYTYTDVSTAFFPQARARLRDFATVDYQRLDLMTDPAAQGFTDSSFDLVIASNALHAAQDLTVALTHIGGLLADGGHLLAVESHNTVVGTPVFGLLDSFWQHTDTELRPHGPLLAPDGWFQVLEACGFTGTVQAGEIGEPGRSDFSVFLTARRPGADGTPTQTTRTGRQCLVVSLAEAAGDAEMLRALRERLSAAFVAQMEASDAPDDWARQLDQAAFPLDVVVLATADDGASPGELTDQAVRACTALRAFAVATQQLPKDHEVSLWLVTRSTDVDEHGPAPDPGTAAAAWGVARTLANEHLGLRVRRVALAGDAGSVPALAHRLVQEMQDRSDEDEVVLTSGGRFVLRTVALDPPRRSQRGAPYTLALSNPGLRYQLEWRPGTVPVPRPGEVVVRVAAVGLNYRDVLTATALVPAPTTTLGLECAGTVTAVGDGVRDISVGDRVLGLSTACLSTHVRCRADRVVPMPKDMTFAEAATIPTAFLTIWHGLGHLARLSAGETVLVHGGAGGVGLAAIHYAHCLGARVIATAGTPAKRDLLRLLGVEHVLDSRSLAFADQVLELTGGEGVDVVLNSLAGEAMVRSLEVLRHGGRFVELGKRDFYADTSLPLGAFQRGLSLFAMNILPWINEDSPVADAHLAAIREALHAGEIRPLLHRAYPAGRVREAFDCLQHSRHIGKVVITLDEAVPLSAPTTPLAPDPDATYLITGGLGGFGAATARHLATRGARHLTLIGRRGTQTPEAADLLADLEGRGVKVSAYAADAADPTAMRAVMADIDAAGRRLAGVVHAAMVLDDAPLADLTEDRIRAVLAPKMTAGHILHDLTRDRDLDLFVVYSSAAALAGNLRQAHYAAGNLALEALVCRRRRQGLPGLAVQWSAIDGTGYVHRAHERGESIAPFFLGGLPADEALYDLDELLVGTNAGTVMVGHVDWDWAGRFLHNLAAPRTAGLLSGDSTDNQGGAEPAAAPRDRDAVADSLSDLLAHILQTDAQQIDRQRPLEQLGMDSLTAAELGTLIQRRLGCQVPTMELLSGTNLTALADRVHARLAGR